MIWPQLQSVAQIAIGRTLNSLPEGLLIALFAGGDVAPFARGRTREHDLQSGLWLCSLWLDCL